MIATIVVLAQTETAFYEPSYFVPVIFSLLLLGAVTSLIAAVLGFARAKAFGPSARWFSYSAVSLILYHLQFLALGFGLITKNNSLIFNLLTFFNVFVIIAAFCSVMGFVRLTNPR